jgi:hypothetical protein
MTVEQKNPDPAQKNGTEKGEKDTTPVTKTEVKKTGRLSWVFGKDTRLGRFNRSLVRTAGWTVAFFALGFLTVYLMLYLPLFQDHARLSQAYGDSQQQLKTAQAGFKATQEASQKVQAVLDQTRITNGILDINNQVLQLELALSQHDQQGAAYYLKKLQSTMTTFLPEVSKIDAVLANMLDTRMKVVAAELPSDPIAAQTDLEVIIKNLQTIVNRLSQ